MMIWLTEVIDNGGVTWTGDRIEAISTEHAEFILETTGRGYMSVIGRLSREIDEETGEMIDYDLLLAN